MNCATCKDTRRVYGLRPRGSKKPVLIVCPDCPTCTMCKGTSLDPHAGPNCTGLRCPACKESEPMTKPMRVKTSEHVAQSVHGSWEPGDATHYSVTVINEAPMGIADDTVVVLLDSPRNAVRPANAMKTYGQLSENRVAAFFGLTNPHTITHITALLCYMLERDPVDGEQSAGVVATMAENKPHTSI